MQKQIASGLCLGLWLTLAQALQAKEAASRSETSKAVFVTEVEGLKEFRSPNGLRIVLFQDDSKPRVTVNVTYFVGSRHEGYGEAGMAHLLEHMLFKGTPSRPDIWKSLQQQGANFNGSTWFDRTNFYETLPASRASLDFALGLEADRMINSSIAPEVLAKEFSVVRNEFEIDENNPSAVLVEQMFHTAFQWHGYGRTTIGNKSDIEQVPPEKLKDFYRRYYQPDNALLVVAGAFKEEEALELINKYFGSIAKPNRTLTPTYTVEPVQEGERRVTLRRNGDQPVVGVLYHTVAGSDPRHPAIDALSSALSEKPSGLLYKELVEKSLAVEVNSSAYALTEPGAMYFMAKVAKGKDPETVSQRLIHILEKLKPEQITETDLKRFKAQYSRAFDLAMTDSNAIGVELSEWAAMGDWRLMFLNRDRIEQLTLAEVRKALAFIKPANRTTGIFIPTNKLDKSPEAQPVNVSNALDNYKGKATLEAGEAFEASFANIEKKTQYAKLSNGLQLAMVAKKSRGAPVQVRLELPLGDAEKLKDRLVALHFLPKLMLRGTKTRTYEQLRDDMALLKAAINGGAGWNVEDPSKLNFFITTVKPKLPEVLNLFAEVLREPRFDAQQFQLAKDESIAELKEELQDPSSLAQRQFLQTLAQYETNDVRHIPTLAEELKAVEKLKLADVKYIHSKLLGGSYGRLVIVGDFEPEAVKVQFEKNLGSWRSPSPYKPIEFSSRPAKAEVISFNTPDKKGAQVAMGQALSLKESDPRLPAVRMAGFIWGQGASSRLINRLRQKDGLSYGAGGGLRADAKSDLGYLSAFAICAPQNVAKAVQAIREELNRFVNDGVSEEELKGAQQAYAEQRKNSLARDGFIMELLLRSMELQRPLLFEVNLDKAIAELKFEQVNAVIKELIKPKDIFTIQALDQHAASAVTAKLEKN